MRLAGFILVASAFVAGMLRADEAAITDGRNIAGA